MPPKKATNSTKNLNNQPRIDSFGEKGAGASKHRDTTGTPSLDSGVRTRATVPRVVRLKAPFDAAEAPRTRGATRRGGWEQNKMFM